MGMRVLRGRGQLQQLWCHLPCEHNFVVLVSCIGVNVYFSFRVVVFLTQRRWLCFCSSCAFTLFVYTWVCACFCVVIFFFLGGGGGGSCFRGGFFFGGVCVCVCVCVFNHPQGGLHVLSNPLAISTMSQWKHPLTYFVLLCFSVSMLELFASVLESRTYCYVKLIITIMIFCHRCVCSLYCL